MRRSTSSLASTSAVVKAKADTLFEIFAGEVAARCPALDLLTPRRPGGSAARRSRCASPTPIR